MWNDRWFRSVIAELERMRDEVNAEINRLTRERDEARLRATTAEAKLRGEPKPTPKIETRELLRGNYGEDVTQ